MHKQANEEDINNSFFEINFEIRQAAAAESPGFKIKCIILSLILVSDFIFISEIRLIISEVVNHPIM